MPKCVDHHEWLTLAEKIQWVVYFERLYRINFVSWEDLGKEILAKLIEKGDVNFLSNLFFKVWEEKIEKVWSMCPFVNFEQLLPRLKYYLKYFHPSPHFYLKYSSVNFLTLHSLHLFDLPTISYPKIH